MSDNPISIFIQSGLVASFLSLSYCFAGRSFGASPDSDTILIEMAISSGENIYHALENYLSGMYYLCEPTNALYLT
ncbi:hypothetical protein DXA81_20070 [Bacteroides fragilis]|nr:hypothetical protein DXA81_20070 [Bacteroides fragilis]